MYDLLSFWHNFLVMKLKEMQLLYPQGTMMCLQIIPNACGRQHLSVSVCFYKSNISRFPQFENKSPFAKENASAWWALFHSTHVISFPKAIRRFWAVTPLALNETNPSLHHDGVMISCCRLELPKGEHLRDAEQGKPAPASLLRKPSHYPERQKAGPGQGWRMVHSDLMQAEHTC